MSRYVLLAPYLRSLESAEQSESENVRLDSIREHFDKLTEMTPTKPVIKEVTEEEEKEEGVLDTSEEEEEEVVEPKPKKPHFEESKDRGRNLRDGAQTKQRNKKKRDKFGKNQRKKTDTSETASEDQQQFDYSQVNFKSFAGKKSQDNKDFSPNVAAEKENKKGGKKKQQFQKRGNKSFTYKKS